MITEVKDRCGQRSRSRAQIPADLNTFASLVWSAPHKTKVLRLNEVKATRQPNLRWKGKAAETEITWWWAALPPNAAACDLGQDRRDENLPHRPYTDHKDL